MLLQVPFPFYRQLLPHGVPDFYLFTKFTFTCIDSTKFQSTTSELPRHLVNFIPIEEANLDINLFYCQECASLCSWSILNYICLQIPLCRDQTYWYHCRTTAIYSTVLYIYALFYTFLKVSKVRQKLALSLIITTNN